MNINNIMEFFYEKTSKRVKEKIKNSGSTYENIFPSDPKQLSWIINNNRTKNNRYLICDAVIKYEDKDKKNEHYGLIMCCDFKDKKEVLWGTETEIESYLPDLFLLLFNELNTLDLNNAYNSKSEYILYDYVPYAKYSAYWKILFSSNNIHPAIFYGIYEDQIINNIDSSRNEAIRFLYIKCKNRFAKIFKKFADNTRSYSKIPDVFEKKFINQNFIPMLDEIENKMKEKASLGLRVRDLILNDLSMSALLIVGKDNNNNEENIKNLINASSKYICKLEEIQNNMAIIEI